MSSLGSPSPFFLSGKKAYTVERSLRFNDDDNAYLQRQPSSSTSGSSQKITISFWIKIGNIPSGTNGGTFFGSSGNTHIGQFFNQTLYFDINSSYWINTEGVFRDPTAWYHVVYAIDTTENTTSNRQKIYVNGVLQGRGNTISDPSQNGYVDFFNNSSKTYYIGRRQAGNYFDGYLAEINFIDGQAYDPSYFGETDALTGKWNPKKYTGSYGTNGFYLNFSDNSALGTDSSGNGNNFTPNNIGTGDAVKDSPTNNFAVLNVLNCPYDVPTFSEGSLKWISNTNLGSNTVFASFQFPKTGKWYLEVAAENINTGNYGYAQPLSMVSDSTNGRYLWWVYGQSQAQINTNSGIQNVGSVSNGDIFQLAYDADSGKVWMGKNNTWFLSGDPSNGTAMSSPITVTNDNARFYIDGRNGTSTNRVIANFGQDSSFANYKTAQGNVDANGQGDFYYAPPTGFKGLCSANLPDPTIKLPNQHFDVVRYVGNNSTNAITSYQFAPDFVWIKNNDLANESSIHDTLRGPNKALRTVVVGAEQASSQNDGLVSFDSNGFTLGDNSSSPQPDINYNVSNYTSYGWNGGGAESKTYKVKVVADSTDYGHGTGSNKYQFFKSDGTTGFGTNGVDLDLEEGGTYIFDWSDSSAQNHPIRFSLTNDGTHSSGTSAGSEYTTGVVKDDSAYKTTITIASGVANLFYYCQNHSGMGAEIYTNTTKGSSNFDGSIKSLVKANPSAGFSIVAYTGNGNTSANTTIGHGLGVSPDLIITKMRTATGTDFGWSTWHHKLLHGSYGQDVGIWLNKTDGQNPAMWAGYSNFSSTVFTPADLNYNNVNTAKYVNYLFSEVEGYSRFGKYTGNGSSNGPFVFCGFRPAFLLVKIFSTTQAWTLVDFKRDVDNPTNYEFYPDLTQGDGVYTGFDLLSNGFKLRGTNTWQNQSGQNFIFIAFAESPFKYARAR